MKKLTSVNVPWMVSPSMPSIKLISEGEERTSIQFYTLFGTEPASQDEASDRGIGAGERGLRLEPNVKSGRYQLISLVFKTTGWILRSPQLSDSNVIDSSLYDWSGVRGRIMQGESADDWKARFLSEWDRTKICPDPGFYVVSGSDWKVHEAEKWRLNHYFIVGDSSSIEILARDVEWISEGRVLGW